MNIEEKIKHQYMKILYEKLELYKIDDYFKANGVLPKEIVGDSNQIISRYFFLFNNVNLNNLTSDELEKIKMYFSFDLSKLDNDKIYEINDFLLNNMFKILITKSDKKYIGYGDINPSNVVPSDAITFVCHFLRYNNNSELITKIVYDKLNYIQDSLSKEKNIKLAVIPCDELRTINIVNKKERI